MRLSLKEQKPRPLCIDCKIRPCLRKGLTKLGFILWNVRCASCHKKKYNMKNIAWKTYRRYKKNKCESCGFIPIHACQLDVDHIDNDHKNNDLSNLKTLCANCHRLKTHLARPGVIL